MKEKKIIIKNLIEVFILQSENQLRYEFDYFWSVY